MRLCELYTPTMGVEYYEKQIAGTLFNKLILKYNLVDCVRLRNKIPSLLAFSKNWSVSSWTKCESELTDQGDLCHIVAECIDFYIGQPTGYICESLTANELEIKMITKI